MSKSNKNTTRKDSSVEVEKRPWSEGGKMGTKQIPIKEKAQEEEKMESGQTLNKSARTEVETILGPPKEPEPKIPETGLGKETDVPEAEPEPEKPPEKPIPEDGVRCKITGFADLTYEGKKYKRGDNVLLSEKHYIKFKRWVEKI